MEHWTVSYDLRTLYGHLAINCYLKHILSFIDVGTELEGCLFGNQWEITVVRVWANNCFSECVLYIAAVMLKIG